MGKLKTFFRRLGSGSFKRMFMQINLIHKETGKNRFFMFFDMIWCIFRYSVGYLDYHVFGFALIRGKKRRTFMTMNDNLKLSHALNSKEYFHFFDDKLEFDEKFKDYIGREFIDIRKAGADGLKKFCENKTCFFAKPLNAFGGSGITKEKIDGNTNYEELYERLVKNGQFLVEEAIVQHEKMNGLSPSSINTIRIVTLVYNGETHFMYALVRMSNGIEVVDNICSGGMYTAVGVDGVIRKPAWCDATSVYYDAHPRTKTVFNGFEIPLFKEAVEMCKKAADVIPEVGYVGWDAAITPERPVLVEGNTLPSYDMVQNYGHLEEKTGILPRFEEIVGKDFFK